MIRFFYFVIFFFIISCNNIEFVYEDRANPKNPLYENTKVNTSGVDLIYIKSYVPMLFGHNKNHKYNLLIDIEEAKIKRAVETNQATSNLRYELTFTYKLTWNEENCLVYEKKLLSYFSIIPKSAGYNYGTDSSLEKKYELAITNNLEEFVSLLSKVELNKCK